jgi:hypothetical protein
VNQLKLLRNSIKLLLFTVIIIALTPRLSFSKDNFQIEKDSTEVDEDTLGNYADMLLDRQSDENDRLDSLWDVYYTYGLFGKIGYTTDMQYRGYQGAGAQSAFFPGLFYHHPIGLGAVLNFYNIKGTAVPWDEIEFGLNYNHSFTDNFSLGLSYTHYIFNDTSEIAKQGITGIADLSLSYEFPFISIGTSFDVSFDDQTDYSFNISLSKRIDLIKRPSFRIWLEPDFSGIFGTEAFLNEKINQKLNGNGHGNGHGNGTIVTTIVTTTSHVFSVLAYQLSIPLNIQVGRFIIVPQYDYVIPLNQPSTTHATDFGFFTINVSCKIF